jgi:ADP-ribose pyrophosphatase YjhB (NUDIX family)
MIPNTLMRAWWRLSRGVTLGVRAIATDEAGRVMLVRHSYTPGWHLPGGGVEHGQTAEDGLSAELREEAGIEMTSPADLIGVYSNHAVFRNDHVLLYRVRQWQPCPPSASAFEITGREFFALANLPSDLSRGASSRLAEVFFDAERSPYW